MAGIVTALEVQKKNKQRVNVYLDEEYAFSLSVLLAARLKRGQYLSDETIARLQDEDLAERGYDQALRFLAYRPRSQAEVERYLTRKGFNEGIVQQTLRRLKRANLIDDASFAQFWVENRQQFRPRGVMALRYEMRAKGLNEEDISEAIRNIDDEQSAYELARAQARRKSDLAPQELRRRLGQYLARRGFPYSVIRSVIQRLEKEEADEIDGEGTKSTLPSEP